MDTHRRIQPTWRTLVAVFAPALGFGFVSTADPAAVAMGFGFVCIGFVMTAARR